MKFHGNRHRCDPRLSKQCRRSRKARERRERRNCHDTMYMRVPASSIISRGNAGLHLANFQRLSRPKTVRTSVSRTKLGKSLMHESVDFLGALTTIFLHPIVCNAHCATIRFQWSFYYCFGAFVILLLLIFRRLWDIVVEWW